MPFDSDDTAAGSHGSPQEYHLPEATALFEFCFHHVSSGAATKRLARPCRRTMTKESVRVHVSIARWTCAGKRVEASTWPWNTESCRAGDCLFERSGASKGILEVKWRTEQIRSHIPVGSLRHIRYHQIGHGHNKAPGRHQYRS